MTLSSRSRLPRSSASCSIVSPMALSIASSWLVKWSIVAAATLVAVLSPRPLPMRFFHSARLRIMPARMVCSSHSRRIAGDGGVHGSGLNNSAYSQIRAASTLVGLVATELGGGEVTDLCRIGDADDVARLVQCQRHAEAMTAGR